MHPAMKMVPLQSLQIHPTNLITQPDMKLVTQLIESIQREGFRPNHPLLVTPPRSSIHLILDGKHRFLAATAAGINLLPVVISEVANDVEAMTATTIDNTFINPITRKLPKGTRVINTFRKCLESAVKEPWTHAQVNKSDWYSAKAVVEQEIEKAKQGLPDLSAIVIIDRMLSDRNLSELVHDLYHNPDAWETMVNAKKSNAPRETRASGAVIDAITALSKYLQAITNTDTSLPQELRDNLHFCLKDAKHSRRNSETAHSTLARLCEITVSLSSRIPGSNRLF